MRQNTKRAILIPLLIVGLMAGAWGLRAWWRYPHVPDVKKVATTQAVIFMASDDFNHLTNSHRKRYVLGLIDTLRGKTFPELTAMMLSGDDRQKQAAKNIGQLTKADREEIGSQFMQIFLDKFYEMDDKHRADCLSLMVVAGAKNGAAKAKEYGLPTADALKGELAKFITNQPPHAQAQMSQFMLDFSKQQEAMGVRPKW